MSTDDDCDFTDDETAEVSLEQDVQQPEQDSEAARLTLEFVCLLAIE